MNFMNKFKSMFTIKRAYKEIKMKSIFCTVAILVYVTPVLADTTFVSGTIVSQNWTASGSPYIVTGDILVAGLTINPGVTVRFAGNFVFEVAGVLNAAGTEQSPIFFTTAGNVVSWKGILFQNSNPGSSMLWCIIVKSNNSGIRIIESFPNLSHCVIRNNQSAVSGGGLKISITLPGELTLNDCEISSNMTPSSYPTPPSHGGGIWVFASNGTVRFVRCKIENNEVSMGDGNVDGGGARISGNVQFIQTVILRNKVTANDGIPGGSSTARGGGVYIDSGTVTFANCIISENRVSGYAPGGMSGNSGYAYGGGIYINNGVVKFLNSIIARDTAIASHGNQGGGIYTNSGQTIIENTTLVWNNIHAIYKISTANVSAVNSIVYFNNNSSSQFSGTVPVTYSDVQGGYTGAGNINFNPVFNSSFQIVLGSPCIDAGSPDTSYNDVCFPPSLGTARNDMGAHGGPGACNWNIISGVHEVGNQVPNRHTLFQNFPNPFNPTTNIKLDIPRKLFVKLIIYNSLGKEVTTLVNEELNAGSYQADWNASDFPNGVYFYKLQTDGFAETKRMVLLK